MNEKNVRRVLLVAVLAAAAPLIVVQACGPDFEPEVFVPAHHPVKRSEYGKGQLGLVQSGYYIAEKTVAFRYMNGGTLDAREQAQWALIDEAVPDWETLTPASSTMTMTEAELKAAAENTPAAHWYKARLSMGNNPPVQIVQDKEIKQLYAESTIVASILNCPDAAMETAVKTLGDRTKVWGRNSATLKNWIDGQDTVFANCSDKGTMPDEAPESAPLLLKQDRAYQKAAARFYQGDFQKSREAFSAIAKDTASPWSKWGDYLAARSYVRTAFLEVKGGEFGAQATFDSGAMQKAAELLRSVLERSKDPEVRGAAQAELNFVLIRTEPQKQVERLANVLGGPGHDPTFGQDLIDMRFVLDHSTQSSKQNGGAPLLKWMLATGTPATGYSVQGAAHPDPVVVDATSEWNKTHSAAWLAAALVSAKSADDNLLRGAASVPVSSPAYATVQFHRARLLLAKHDLAEARAVSSAALTALQAQRDVATTNAFLQLRMATAGSLQAMLKDAPREALETSSQAASLITCTGGTADNPCKPAIATTQFDSDTAVIFNARLPLSMWAEAAESVALPPHLRSDVVRATWLRALLLNDGGTAKKMIPLLPEKVSGVLGRSADPNGYAATLVLLHSPGLRPYLEQGVQRSESYPVLDSFRDNWWCQRPSDSLKATESPMGTGLPAAPEPVFLTSEARGAARSETATLEAQPGGVVWLGRRTLDYVKAHPEEPVAAESLSLVVRATRYGCSRGDADDKAKTLVSKEAFNLLHSRYPKSEWAAKTKYYY